MPSSPFQSRRRLGRLLCAPGMLALSVLSACDVPTSIPDAPIVDLKWVVPTQGSRITVAELLPSNVTILPDSSGFQITVTSPPAVTRTLSQDCPECAAANGLSVPKPAFTATASSTTSLPANFASATLTGGTLQVVVTNRFTFDPLIPSAAPSAPKGFMVITVSSGSTVIGKDSVNGATTALPAGGSLTRNIALAGALTGGVPVTVSMVVNSPAGDVVVMDASRTITVAATVSGLRVATANVTVAGRTISSTTSIDLVKVDSSVSKRVKGGALLLTVANPFTVAGTLTVRFAPSGGASFTKTIQLAAGSSTPRIDFTESEIRSLLGKVVTVTYDGVVNSSGGPVSVSPKQAVIVSAKFELNLQVGA